jgi:flagellar hook-length control protein FliK
VSTVLVAALEAVDGDVPPAQAESITAATGIAPTTPAKTDVSAPAGAADQTTAVAPPTAEKSKPVADAKLAAAPIASPEVAAPAPATPAPAAPIESAARATVLPIDPARPASPQDAAPIVSMASGPADAKPLPAAGNHEALERLMVTNAVATDKDRDQPITRTDANAVERIEATEAKPSALAAATQRAAAPQHQAEGAAARSPGSVPAQLAHPIARAVRTGADRIEIHLAPAELGRVDIKLEISQDGRVQAVFAVDRPQTADLLQRDVRELARALQDAGLQTDAGSLSFNLRNQNQGQAHPWMANASDQHGGAPERAEAERIAPYRPMIVSDDQVDFHV